jgi:hypothetical protein
MGLGTKNRQKQTADICKQHLRERYRDQRGLLEEFILEYEGDRKNCDVTCAKRETNCRRAGKDRQRDWGCKAGMGGWSGEVLTPSAECGS